LREILGPKKDDVTGEWRKLPDEELNGLYCSPNIIRVIKSRRMIWAGHVVCMGRGEVHAGFGWGKLRERDHLEDLDINWTIIVKRIFRKWEGRHGLDLSVSE
jgi:hypothetical protein